MSNLDDDTPEQHAVHFPPNFPTSPPVADVENKNKSPDTTPIGPTTPPMIDVEEKSPSVTFETTSGIVRRWKKEDSMKRGLLALTGLALLFSLLSFIVMAANNRGNGLDFNRFQPYRYVLAVAILSTVYTGCQAFRQAYELWTGKRLFQQRTSVLLDFIGDQIMAYLLISAASSAVPFTNLQREATDSMFTDYSALAFVDTSAASISMAFLAFFALASSAIISGYKLSTQSYI